MNNAQGRKAIQVLTPEIIESNTAALAHVDTISISALATEFLSVKVARGEISEKSAAVYRPALNRLVEYLNARNIAQPCEDDIFAYKAALVSAGLKATTIALYLTAARNFFKWAGRKFRNAALAIVADDVKAPKIDKGQFRREFLNAAQAKAVITNIDRTGLMGKRNYAIVLLMVTTGLRTIEVARANIGDMQNGAYGPVLYVQGKGRSEKDRFVKLTGRVVMAIRDYLNARGAADDSDPLFTSTSPNNRGGRLTTRTVSTVAKSAMQRAGLNRPTLTAHSLRHTAAVINITNGGTLYETQQLLRHASPVTTEIYTHIAERMNNNSECRIETAIFAVAAD